MVGRKTMSRIWFEIHFLTNDNIRSCFRLFIIFLKSLQVCSYGPYCCYGEKRGMFGIQLEEMMSTDDSEQASS